MKRFSTFLAALLCTATAIFADGPFRNHRYDSFKVLNVTSDNIVFIGNSITDMHCWPEAFVTSNGDYLPIVNRGNSGTYSTEQSDNLESYINGKPKKVFMMIGTNDIATSGGLNFSPEQVLAYIKSIVTRIHAHSPNTKVYLYSILNNNTSNRVQATWLKTNEIVKAYADATTNVTYVDLYDKLTNVANGGAWSYDNLHLTAGAYQAWCETICQYLQEGEDYTVSCVYPENTLEVQNRGGLGNAAHGMRATYFSCLPIKSNDVLVFGDSFIKNGEWQELLGNPNVKNRGTGWNNSGDIATTSKIVDATYANVEGVAKADAKAIFLYTGTADCTGSTDIATVKANYKALVDKIVEKSPTSKIYLMAICPRNNASHNTRIAELNAYMESLKSDKIRYIDTYTPMFNSDAVNSSLVFSNDYIGGLAYAKIANLMKETLLADFPSDTYNVVTEADAATRYAQAGLRNQLTQVIARGLVAERGDEAGQYNAAKMAAFDTKLTEATTLLEKSSITQDEVTAMANSLTTILNGALSMPTNSTQGNEVWYQLYTPNRSNKYLTSNGAGAGVTGNDKHNYATGMWKFVLREDGTTLDIINRNDNSYLAPTAAYNAQITTSATQPTNGWTLSYANTPGLFIISSGTVQLNQTTLTNTPVYNWSNGQTSTDRGDTGCQYMVSIVKGEPDELPDPSLLTLTLTTNEFQSGQSTWTKNVSSSDGWYGKFVTNTTPVVTVESTDKTVNNMGWSNKRPWLQTGYSYNISLPEGYIIVGYDLTTLEGGGFSGTYTYTTAEGTATSPAQTGTAQTVTATGLATQTITLKVGEGTDGTKGIMMTNLVIRYKELLPTLTYTIDKENGNLYKDNGTSANQSWNSAWRSNAEPQLVFSCPANNMNWVDNNVQMMTGQATTSTYTLTVPDGYVIGSYSFTFANNNHDTGLSLAMTGGNTYTTTRAAQTISARNQKLSSMSFVLSGTNGNGVILTNFTVTFVDPAIAGKEEVEEEDAELTAAKTEAKATVTANAAKLDDALGYYSYTIDGVKVYDASEVTAAIDAATAVAEVEAIVATYSLNLPEVGKYYRIKGKDSGRYLDAVNRHSGNQMGMKTEAERDFLGSIFFLDEGSKWLNMGTNTYIKDTYNIGADKAGANTWTFEASPRTLGCLLLKSSGSSPYLHDSGYANRCSGDGGHAAHDFVLEEVAAYSLTVEAPAIVGATATWNGETKTLPAVWALFEGTTITDGTLTINGNENFALTGVKEGENTINGNTLEISTLTANRTITASFTPTFFSANLENLVPVHIYSIRDKNYTICLNEAADYAGHAVNSGTTDYTLNEVWYLVGTAESFKMYSYTAGMGLALTLAGTGSGSAATMTATGTDLCLNMVENGYTICPKGTPGQSFNMHGAKGNDIKLYSSTDGGSVWGVNVIDITKPLTLNVEVSGEQPYAPNFRVANLSTTIAGQIATSIITGDVEARTYYLPAGATITLNNAYIYRGYTFDGFKDAEGNAAEYNDTPIPAGGLEVTASYSVDEDNKYQYLFYSNDPVMNKPYRIPAIAVTRKGTILAVTDHRPGGSDVGFAPVDIKIRRSDDNGLTWTDEEFVADGTGQHVTVGDVTHTNVFNYAFGDAAIVADRESDEVLIMCVGGKQNFPGADATHHNYTARLRSHDGGVTWDEPENVTANFMDVTPLYNNENPKGYEPILPEAYSLFYGSGRILQSRVFKAEGSQYYRIYAALLVREVRENETGASHNNYVVYSDNFGETWNLLGGRCVNGGDEAKVEELPDGTIIISSRKGNGRYFNIFTFTDIAAGTGSWSSQVASETITGGISFGNNACNGEIYKVKAIHNETGRICDVMLQSTPTGQRGDYTADGRNDVTIFFKEMNYSTAYTPTTFAENWTKGLVVSRVRSAYSTMDIQLDGKIAFFYEEDPESYSMVYVPLSLEEMTNGAYSLYTVNSTISEHGIGTFYTTSAMQIPEGVQAYVATEQPTMENGTGVITMTELVDIIPANTGAVLRGAANTYTFIPSISYGTAVEDNMLVGYEANNKDANLYREEQLAEGYTTYVLAVMQNEQKKDVVGFYKKEAGFKVYNNKAYLQVPATISAGSISIRFDDGTTDIETSEIRNEKSEMIFDLMGRRVENPTKGVYIVGGRKVVIK
ncbi:MAG: hypothetical protein IKY72_07685 [Bacteroidaceae bacterium]|nr:hypothetical protein [Bacteroidaceae bacterium]